MVITNSAARNMKSMERLVIDRMKEGCTAQFSRPTERTRTWKRPFYKERT